MEAKLYMKRLQEGGGGGQICIYKIPDSRHVHIWQKHFGGSISMNYVV